MHVFGGVVDIGCHDIAGVGLTCASAGGLQGVKLLGHRCGCAEAAEQDRQARQHPAAKEAVHGCRGSRRIAILHFDTMTMN